MLSQGLALVLFLQMFPPSCLSLSPLFLSICLLSDFPFSGMRNFPCLAVCFLCQIQAEPWPVVVFPADKYVPNCSVSPFKHNAKKVFEQTVSIKHVNNTHLCFKQKLSSTNLMFIQTQVLNLTSIYSLHHYQTLCYSYTPYIHMVNYNPISSQCF